MIHASNSSVQDTETGIAERVQGQLGFRVRLCLKKSKRKRKHLNRESRLGNVVQ